MVHLFAAINYALQHELLSFYNQPYVELTPDYAANCAVQQRLLYLRQLSQYSVLEKVDQQNFAYKKNEVLHHKHKKESKFTKKYPEPLKELLLI